MQRTAYTPLVGGLDLVSRPIVVPGGRAIGALNYEPHPSGYARVDGFERFDGRPKPSQASYWVLNFDAGSVAIADGATVTGASSGATGIALFDGVVSSGSYGAGDAAGLLILTAVSGDFQDDEDLQVSAVKVAEANGEAAERGASNDTDNTTWIREAIETARGNIQGINGSGRLRGAWLYGGVVYAFRDAADGSVGCMHKATASGWAVVDLGQEILFDAGTSEFAEGDTLTGATSGATAKIKRVIVTSGDWTTNDAVGYLVLADIMGLFQDSETITDGAGGSATSDGANTAITLPPGGRYEFRNHNFYGASNLRRMYGVNGVGNGFEFDGTVFVPIRTGMAIDKPNHLAIQYNHLFFAFPGGSIQNSATGNPYNWEPILGAGEIGLGDDVTGMLEDENGAMAIFGRQKTAVLYGRDNTDWELIVLSSDAGGIEWTIQKIGTPLYQDNRGVRSLDTTDRFGNFRLGTVTHMVEPLFRAKRRAGVTPTASMRVRSKDLYRLFFSDGSGISIYFGNEAPEILPFNLGRVVYATCASEENEGDEALFFGSDDGFLYQLDSGTSFDGNPVSAFVRLPFNHIGTPTRKKRWHKATVEVDASPNTRLGVVAEFAYADPGQPPAQRIDFTVQGGGGFWNEANWDEFFWSSPIEGLAESHIDGLGRNISIGIVSEETYQTPHILHGLNLHYSYRGLER